MDSNAKPWGMVMAGRYAEAADVYEAKLANGPMTAALLGEYGTAMLALNRFSSALQAFQQANDVANKQHKGVSRPYLNDVGVVLSLLGRTEEAIGSFKTAVDSILDGSIGYADAAGGASQGLLLWYEGVAANRGDIVKHALKYLCHLRAGFQIKLWPGPLALFALGEKNEEEILQEACGVGQLDAAVELAKKDLLKRRRLVNSLFYFGVRQRVNGSEEHCREWMQRCAALENPIIECEWYLARGEVEKKDQRS